MSVAATVVLYAMDLSGVFCVADSDVLQDAILWGCTHVLCGSPTLQYAMTKFLVFMLCSETPYGMGYSNGQPLLTS